ncbi:hypothetical protein D0Z00_004429 [Geotrichum galactomycetum]|uniref:Uncharacterized protein n=1 Tax=Geotrichum galactomycetum TaxID=27317 RepID=A0ACB6UYH8_9ASCO|nr:hypothetical protein D0Z00_004429 [Geotrichum candidum]
MMLKGLTPYRLAFGCRRCQSTSAKLARDKKSKPKKDNNDDEDSGYMLRRLAQLAEESRPFKDDPKAGQPYFPSTTDTSFDLAANAQRHYEYKHQREIAIATKIPRYADASTRAIAQGNPWTGEEHLVDTAHRMLQDAHKPLAATTAKSGPTGVLAAPRGQPKLSVSSRLATAREKSLDYKLNPRKGDSEPEEEKSGPTFKELYAERFTGISSMTNDFSAIASLATQRIEASIARGEFEVLPGRGKETPRDPNLSSPYIDHTEYYLNNMLKRQGAMPVWIDRQGSVHARTREFRVAAGRSWLTHAVHFVAQAHPGPADTKARRQLTAQIRAAFTTHAATTEKWKALHAGFHAAAVRELNSAVRSYNLQAPSAARRGYLDVNTELDAAIAAILPELDAAVDNYLHGTAAATEAKVRAEQEKNLGWHQLKNNELPSLRGIFSAGAAAGSNGGGGVPLSMELPLEKGLMKNLFKNLFKVEDLETLAPKKKRWGK